MTDHNDLKNRERRMLTRKHNFGLNMPLTYTTGTVTPSSSSRIGRMNDLHKRLRLLMAGSALLVSVGGCANFGSAPLDLTPSALPSTLGAGSTSGISAQPSSAGLPGGLASSEQKPAVRLASGTTDNGVIDPATGTIVQAVGMPGQSGSVVNAGGWDDSSNNSQVIPVVGEETYTARQVPIDQGISPPFGAPYEGVPYDGITGLPGNVPGDTIYAPAPALPPIREADLVINGWPARTGRIMFGGAVNSDAGVTGQVTLDERNFDIMRWPTSFQDLFSGTAFKGAGQTFRVEAVPGSEYQRYMMTFADPNLLGYLPISMSLSGFLYDRRFNDWDEERLGGRISFGYIITPDLSIRAGVSGQNVNVSRPRVLGVPQLDAVLGDSELYTGQVSLVHNTRDSPLQPGSGHYLELKFEEAFGDFDYARFEVDFRQYWQVAERADGSGRQTVSFRTQAGFSGKETPLFENFFAGGYATMRGFDFRGASPSVGGVEVGGRFQWLNSLEYMFPITADDAFRGVAFVDFGTVEQNIEIDADNFRVAPGFGVRVAIPMLGPAPLAFDFAFPVAMADTDDEKMFSFYMSTVR